MFPDARGSRAATRVIYIDDNEVNLRVVGALMEALDIAVTCYSSASDALDLLESEPFDMVFTDIHMPEMSGFDVLRQLRGRSGPNRSAPVVALTADLTRDAAQYRELGFSGFVPKPVTLRALCECLLALWSTRGRATAA